MTHEELADLLVSVRRRRQPGSNPWLFDVRVGGVYLTSRVSEADALLGARSLRDEVLTYLREVLTPPFLPGQDLSEDRLKTIASQAEWSRGQQVHLDYALSAGAWRALYLDHVKALLGYVDRLLHLLGNDGEGFLAGRDLGFRSGVLEALKVCEPDPHSRDYPVVRDLYSRIYDLLRPGGAGGP